MNITYCEQCRGVKSITFPNDTGYAESKEVFPAGPMKFCCGHSAPAPEHDGKLDKDGRCSVRYVEEFGRQVLLTNGGSHEMVFYPDSMLSLLSWLQQERETLERLAGGDEA